MTIIVSEKAQKEIIEGYYDCKTLKEFRDEYCPKYTLQEVADALEWEIDQYDYELNAMDGFLAGITYQKKKEKKR